MTLSSGERLGPYEIVAPLGAGGMGEVYRARDGRLNREVAVKVLPAPLAQDEDRLRRFEREARAAGSLNHPNILTVHDVGQHEGRPFLVTELIEGRTLREWLRDGPLPRRKAAEVAIQLARGLAAAHERGIVHRDLKPENVIVTPDGRVKILDFGLATHSPAGVPGSDLSELPTESLTAAGSIVGTLGYLSPEQARGEELDARSDLFALGAILYEMLSGRRAFAAGSPAETLAAILTREPPPLEEQHAKLPPALARIVRHCLEKQAGERYQSARDLAFDLEQLSESGVGLAQMPRPRRLAPLALAALAAAAVAGAVWLRSSRRADPPAARLRQVTVAEGVEQGPAWSPDGRNLAYSAESGATRHIFVRDFESGAERQLTRGPHDDSQPAWSPDGQTLLFVRGRQAGSRLEPGDVFGPYDYAGSIGGDVWSIELATGRERWLIENAYNPAPAPDGTQLAIEASWVGGSRIWLVDAQGNNPRQLTSDASEEIQHLRPRWSGDSRLVAFQTLARAWFDVRVVELASKRVHAVTDDALLDLGPVFDPSGRWLLFSSYRSGGLNLWRVPLARSGAPTGGLQQLTTGAGQDVEVAPSPDGRRLAFAILRQNSSLWRLPVEPGSGRASGTPQQVVASTREDSRGAWSPDGQQIAFNSDRAGEMNLWLHDAGTGATRQATHGPGGDFQPNWSPDGGSLTFFSHRAGSADIWAVDLASGHLTQLTREPGLEINPFFAPDGAHIVYQSDRSGRVEVWVMGSDGSEQRQLTSNGARGHFMRWTPDGARVVYGCLCGSTPGVASVPLAGGPPVVLEGVAGGAHLSFSPDSSRLMDVVGHKAIWMSPLHGSPEKVFEFEDPSVRIDYTVWSPDGRYVLFDRFRPGGGDIWLLEPAE